MNFNPAFEKYQELYGFDDSVKPHWQMVPLSGEKKVYLANAEGMTVSAIDSKIIQISEIAENSNALPHKKRLFSIRGNSYGTTFVEVRKNNLLMTKLEVAVKKPKIVSLAFNFVSDKTGRKTKKLLCDVQDWLDGLNEIYEPQTNVSFIRRSTNTIKIENNLGPEIDFTDAKGSSWESDTIIRKGDESADINLFFIWKIVDRWEGEAYFPKGKTSMSTSSCFVGDAFFRNDENEIIVMAHEIGHALGIPGYMHLYYKENRKRYMMFSSARFAGKEIQKVPANVVNP